ncbi:MAG: tryptophan synthase subunit alpha, partial [Nitrosopumilaceae archaeon]
MSRIKNKFLELKKKKEKALIAYIMVGYPNEKT